MITTGQDLFTVLTFNKGETVPAEVINDLLDGKITGVIFREFFSKEEVDSVLGGFNKIPLNEKTQVNNGFVSYPLSFAQLTQKMKAGQIDLKEYTSFSSALQSNIGTIFGLEFIKRLIGFLEGFPAFTKVEPIYNSEYDSFLIPFNIRELLPGNGELIIHCENLFFQEFPDFFEWLKVMNIKDNKLSYFVTLQNAEMGGELCCFDLNWGDVKYRETSHILKDVNNNAIFLEDHENVKRHFIKPNVGDLFLFAGGNIWHRVEKVQGAKSRITLGGFIAETNNIGEYNIWA